MIMEFEYSFAPTTMEQIAAFENKYKLLLPTNYKSFLLDNNGGKTVKRRFDTTDETITSSIMLFLPLSQEEEQSLEQYHVKYNLGGIVPSNLLPIGIDPAESLICISLHEEDVGSVYLCDMNYYHEDNELKNEHIKLIAKSFHGFLTSLYILQ